VVLEARDRLGGRTWTADYQGMPLEMGGAWVHWLQPYVLTELRRYGIATEEEGEAREGAWVADGVVRPVTVDTQWGIIVEATTAICADARTLFPSPYEPLRADVEEADRFSIQDRLTDLGMDAGRLEVAEGFWSSLSSVHASEVGILSAIHWVALAGYDPEMMIETASGARGPCSRRSSTTAPSTSGCRRPSLRSGRTRPASRRCSGTARWLPRLPVWSPCLGTRWGASTSTPRSRRASVPLRPRAKRPAA
jgi:hypothetical protein